MSLFDGKFGAAQAFDVQRNPAYPEADGLFDLTNFQNIFLANEVGPLQNVDWGTDNDRYVMFVDTASAPSVNNPSGHTVRLDLFEADGTFVRSVSDWGTVWALDDQGFFYEGHDELGYFISNAAGYNYGDSFSYVPDNALVTDVADLQAYPATTMPLAAGESWPLLAYSSSVFEESADNDGSIDTVITLTLLGDTFTGTNGDDWSGLVSNVPAGLTAVLIRTSDTTATLTLTGNATNHADADDISNLTVAFTDSYFTDTVAADVLGAVRNNLVIDFNDPANNLPGFGAPETITQVSIFSQPNMNGNDATPGNGNESANLASIIQYQINNNADYTLDTSIQNFTDADFADKLDASGFFFMTDMEAGFANPADEDFLPISARDSLKDWVNSGGVMMMTGTAGSKDTEFLNLIFNWDLTTEYGSSWDFNAANAAGTPFADGPASLPNLSATDAIGRGSVANFTPIYGTDENATVAVIQYGGGYVIFLGYDFYDAGIAGTGFTATATQYGADVTNGSQRNSDWVQSIVPGAMEYSANLSSSFIMTETDAGLTSSGSMPLTDDDEADEVSVSVTSLDVTYKDSDNSDLPAHPDQPELADLQAMLSLSGNPVINSSSTTGTLNWTFNSGSEAFNYLGAGQKLVFEYTLTASDGKGSVDQTLTLTINGTNDAPVISQLDGDSGSGRTGQTLLLDQGSDAAVADVDSPNFNNGTLTATTQSGTADGNFLFGGSSIKSGVDAGSADTAIKADDKVFHNGTEIGSVSATDDGQGGHNLVITLNEDATPAIASVLLQSLAYRTTTAGQRSFELELTDGQGGKATSTVTLQISNPPSSPEPEPEVIPVPNPDGSGVGDGNGDGIPDHLQQSVASVPFLFTPTPSTEPMAPSVFITLVGGGNEGKVSNDTVQFSNVLQLDKPFDAPDNLKMSVGMISFDAQVNAPGITENFSLYVEGKVSTNGYFKQNNLNEWVNLASKEHGGRVVLEGDKIRLDFSLTDGGEFDASGSANGMILDPGAPAFLSNGQQDLIQTLYMAYYQRPADAPGLTYWMQHLDAADGNPRAIIEAFAGSEESLRLYGEITADNIEPFIDNIYFALFGREAESGGKQFYADAFTQGAYPDGRPSSAATIMLDILLGAQNEDQAVIGAKLDAARLFTWLQDPMSDGNLLVTYDAADESFARDWLNDITTTNDLPGMRDLYELMLQEISNEGDTIQLLGSGASIELAF
ncbi:choice-of-anchor U domain-containing protein [Nitrincola alkalilacustris]|uniref:choice-of-anchor U domain-containing protein n=1 Tax=Nitrincola alkalilacustris TaxID=1571224 RepID=UPI00124E9F8E|nr:choice-of-anchor U domain-containing protein [Nitrincola alkalilacustris]